MPREIRLVAYTNAETWGSRALPDDDPGRATAIVSGHGPRDGRRGGRSDRRWMRRRGDHVREAGEAILGFPSGGGARRVLQRLDPHLCLVNLHTPYCGLHATLAAVLIPRLKVVAIEHLPLPSLSRGAHWLKRVTSRRLAGHVAVSAHTAEAIAEEAEIARERMLVVRNGVSEPAAGKSDPGLPRPIVGGMGRFDRQKVSMFSSTRWQRCPVLRSRGRRRSRAGCPPAARIRSLRDRPLSIVPWTSEIGPFLRSLDVFVLPSRYEGLPLALLEAMATATPIVAADVGAVSEAVVSGQDGLLVPPDDAPALAAGISRLLEAEEERERLGAQAREAWRSWFTAERMQQSYVDLFTRLVR